MSLLIDSPLPAEVLEAKPVAQADPDMPLTEEQFTLLRRAVTARRPVQKAARNARISAITILVVALGSVPLVLLSPDWLSLLMIAGIGTIGIIEYVGANRVRRGLPSAARFLARNQLAFLCLIAGYCGYQMVTFSSSPPGEAFISEDVRTQLAQVPDVQRLLDEKLETWAPLATYGFYSLVIVVTIAVQGGMAVYYFTRRRHLDTLQWNTPPWVQRVFYEIGA